MRKHLLLASCLLLAAAQWAAASTVAYWRFEEGPLNANVNRGGLGDGQFHPGALDSSGNEYHLSAFSNGGWAGEAYRGDVANDIVPLTGATNRFALQNTGDLPGMWTQDAAFNTWTPAEWTVEAWFKPTSVNRWQTIVGRDGDDISGDQPAFSLMLTPTNDVLCRFNDMENRFYFAQSSGSPIAVNQWYHVAAVSDGVVLKVYLNYEEIASATLGEGDTRLSNGTNGRLDIGPGTWTIFRGMWNGGHSDRWYGFIDEVRISGAALDVSAFLANGGAVRGPQDQAVFTEDQSTATFTVTATAIPYNHYLADVQWFKDVPEPNTPVTVDNVKYVVNTTSTGSSLTIYDVSASDQAHYKAKAFFTDGSSVMSSKEGYLYLRSGLVHRYSFNGNALDSVGGAHAVIIDPNALTDPRVSFVDNQLLLDNYELNANPADVNSIAYVELPVGIISNLTNWMTIEMWLTPHRNANWTTFFAFGDTGNANPFVDGFNHGRVGVIGQLNRDGNNRPSFNRFGPGFGERQLNSNMTINVGEEFMYAVTWDGNTNQMRLYVNGVFQASAAIDMRLSDIEDVKCWLGLPFWGDPVLNASINELRIYDTALPGYYVGAHYAAGPDVTAVELKPSVAAPADVSVYPGLRQNDVDSAEMTAVILDIPVGSTVTAVQWYKDPDPTVSGDEIALYDGGTYHVSFSDTETTLRVNDVDVNDDGYYFVKVTISTGASGESPAGRLNVSQGLVHRWSFNGDLDDSVGGAHGTLVDPSGLASFVDGQQLRLNNTVMAPNDNITGVAYVRLPGGIVSKIGNNATFMMWVTPSAKQGNWVNMFAFGAARGELFPNRFDGGDGLIGSLRGDGTDQPLFSYDVNGAQRWKAPTSAALNNEFLFAMSWDGNNGTGTIYVINSAGTYFHSAPITGGRSLANINDVDNLIGCNWWNDYMLNGSINEVRIYDWAFEKPWIEEFYAVGPDALSINPCLEYSVFDVAGGGPDGDEPDCKVDLLDFAAFAQDWLSCGRLDGCN